MLAEIALLVARDVARRGVLPRIGARDLQPVGGPGCEERKSRKRAIDAVVGGRAQFGIAAHRGEEAHRAVRIEPGARRNADADAVGLQLLRAREGRKRDLGARERHRAHLRIVEHVGATRLTSAAWRTWSSRIAAWRAITCAISWDSTEASSEVSLASASRPRVT